MRKIILLILMLPLIGYTQNSAVIAATQMNVLYANLVENPISIAVPEHKNSDLSVTFNYGSIKTIKKKENI